MRSFSLICLLLLSVVQIRAKGYNDDVYRYTYIEAVRQQDLGHYAAAIEMYRRCLRMNPDAAEANYALGTFYLVLHKDSLGLAHVRRAAMLEPDNTEFADRLAQAYLMQNDVTSATDVFEDLSKRHPDRIEYLDMLMKIYQQQHEWAKMLDVLNRLELQEGQSEELTLTKMQAYSYLGDQEGAFREINSLVTAHPGDLNLQVMMGNWMLSNGKKEEALSTFMKVLEEEPDNAQGQMSLMDYYRTEGNTEEASRLLYEMLVNPKTERDTRVTLIRSWVQDAEERGGDSLSVMDVFNKVLALPQTTPEVAEMKAAYLELKKAPAEDQKAAWTDVLQIAPEEVGARLKLIELMWRDSIDEKVIQECKKAIEYIPDEPSLHFQLGMAQYINEHYDDAHESLRRGIRCFTKDTDKKLASEIYCILGDILQKKGQMKEAFESYDSCLVYNPDNTMCLNNYAYFLSLENVELKKAEQMSYKVITVEPDNGTYLDTYAWILYMEQRYEEAALYIEQAIRYDTVSMNSELRDHAGDIYFRLGRTDDAVKMWQEALKLTTDKAAIIQRKIKEKKIIEKK